MELIRLQEVHKVYNPNTPGEVHALQGVDLTVDQGEMVAIMGPSGSGKSTLLHVIGCLDQLTEGTYLLDGLPVQEMSQKQLAQQRNRTFGFVLQDFGLILSKTALENVVVPLVFDPQVPSNEMHSRARAALALVGLQEKIQTSVTQLSGGQKQRVAIARALVNSPKVILADEPTGALDQGTSQEIMDLLVRLNQEQNLTVLISTHDAQVASRCTRVIQLQDGKILQGQ